MNRIVLTAEQLAQVNGGPVEVVDPAGNRVGSLSTDEAFAKLVTLMFPEPTPEQLAETKAEVLTTGGISIAEIREAIDSARRKWEALR